MSVNIPGPHAEMTMDASGFQTGVAQAVASLDSLTNVVRNQWWGLQNLGGIFASIGAAATAGIGLAVNAAVTWESAMADVERTTYDVGLSAEQNTRALEGLEKGIREIASVTPISARGLAEIATQAGQLGIGRDQIVAFTKTVADLSITTQLTEEQAGLSLARIAALTGITGEGFDRLASTILETGRSTAATEPEIVELSRRIAGVGATVGLTADQIIGLSAATTSLGNRAEVSGTSLQRAFNTMNAAVQEGGEELQNFGAIAGVSGEEFARVFREDAAEAFTLFIEGLSRLGSEGVAALKSVGLANERQITVMLTLAAAANNTANENVRLRNVLETSAQAFDQNSALAEITGRRYATLESRIQMVRDQLDEFVTTVGEDITPVFAGLFAIVDKFVRGLNMIPPPLRVVGLSLVTLTALVAGLLAVLTTVVPRIVLMRMALQQMAAGAGALAPTVVGSKAAIEQMAATGIPALNGLAGSMVGVAGAANLMSNTIVAGSTRSAAALAAVNAGQMTMTSYLAATTGQAAAAGVAMGATANSASRMLKVISMGSRVLGVLGTALLALTAITTVLGFTKQRDTDLSFDNAEANRELTAAILEAARGNDAAVNGWIQQQLAMAGVIPIAERLGLTLAQLQAIVRGTASPELMQSFSSTIARSAKQGDAEARKLFDTLSALRGEYSRSATAVQGMAGAQDSAAGSTRRNTEEINKQREALDKRNQALLAYGDAIFAQRSAQFGVQDAQQRYTEALQDAKGHVFEIRKAENALAQARLDQEGAVRALRDAERNLSTARQRAREELLDAEDALYDARERYVDSLESIKDAEEALDKARQGPTLDEIYKATVRLERAQLKLVDAHQAVADTEWQLNYLRREGAGARDIREAELALADARVSVKEADIGQAEAEEELADLRKGVDIEDIVKAERALQKALRNSQKALRDITKRERAFAEARQAVADDRHYRDALFEVRQAQQRLSDSTLRAAEAARELHKTQTADPYREVARAQFDLEQSQYRLAKANVEVQKQSALARGELWDAGREAHALAAELDKVGVGMPDAIRRNLSEISAELRKATPGVGHALEEGLEEGFGGIDLDEMMGPLVDIPGKLEAEITDDRSWIERIGDWIQDNFTSIMGVVGGFIGRWGGAKIGAAIGAWGGPIGAAVGAVVGALVGALVGHLIDSRWGNEINRAFDLFFQSFTLGLGLAWKGAESIVEGVSSGISSAFETFKSSVDTAVGILVNDPATMDRVGTFFSNIGESVSTGFKNFNIKMEAGLDAFREAHENYNFGDFGADLRETVAGWFTGIGSWISEKFATLNVSMESGLDAFREAHENYDFGDFGSDLLESIDIFFEDIGTAFAEAATNIKSWFGGLFSDSKDDIETDLNDINTFTGLAMVDLTGIVESISGSVGPPLREFSEELKTKAKSSLEGMRSSFDSTWNGRVVPFLTNVGSDMNSKVGSLRTTLQGRAEEAIDGFNDRATKVWNSDVGPWLKSTSSRTASTVGSLARTLRSHGGDLVSGLRAGWDDKWSGFRTFLSELGGKIRSAIGDAGRLLWNVGRDILKGLWGGFASIIPDFARNLGRFIPDFIVKPFEDLLDLGSPSKLFEYFGEMVVEGLARGITRNAREVERAARMLAESTVPEFPEATLEGLSARAGEAATPTWASALLGELRALRELAPEQARREGDTINVEAHTDADPYEIGRQVSWAKRTRIR